MEEKLKNFGELFQETMKNRGIAIPESANSSEQILESSEREAILEKLASHTTPSSQAKETITPTSNEDLSSLSFGELLERTLNERAKVENKEVDAKEEIRENVLKKVSNKINMIGDLMKSFGK